MTAAARTLELSSVERAMRLLVVSLLIFAAGACGSAAHNGPHGGGGSSSSSSAGGATGTGGAAGSTGTGGGSGGSTGTGGGNGGSSGVGGRGGAGGADGSGGCSQVTTLQACDARADCHSVFFDPQTCGCASVGCCAHFSSCADGDLAQCKNTAVACTIPTPHCEGTYVIGYSGLCYEGCVRATDCMP
jgi:hypothetical protein